MPDLRSTAKGKEVNKQKQSTEDFTKCLKGLSDFAFIVSSELLKLGKAINDAFYRVYISRGAIYGATQKGYHEWLKSLTQNQSLAPTRGTNDRKSIARR